MYSRSDKHTEGDNTGMDATFCYGDATPEVNVATPARTRELQQSSLRIIKASRDRRIHVTFS